MKTFLLMIICIGNAVHAGIEINNRSAYPFKITSVTYEHDDGLLKTPFIEMTPIVVQPKTHMQFPAMRREPIRAITGVHLNRTYTFDLPLDTQGIITVYPDNRVMLSGPQFMATNKEPDLSLKEKIPGIRRL